jgi:hypothetical protein
MALGLHLLLGGIFLLHILYYSFIAYTNLVVNNNED